MQMMKGIRIELPDEPSLMLTNLVLDFTGTLSLDGGLLPGVAESLKGLSGRLQITILTSDTFGTAKEVLRGLPVEVRLVKNGKEKAEFVQRIGGEKVIAIGNGQNDIEMLRLAALGITVAGAEGCSAKLIAVSDILVSDIIHALDLLKNPLRIKATLRK